MRRLTVGLVIVLFFQMARSMTMAALPPSQPKNFVLKWNYSQVSTNIIYNVYSSTNLALPMGKWPLYTNVTGKSWVTPIYPGNRFFAVKASNTVLRTQSPFLASSAALATVPPPRSTNLTLTWNYPQTSPDIVFTVYSTTNLATPLKKWPVYTNVTSTSCVVRIVPGNHYFTVTASNTIMRTESTFAR
jgi:hypothetical protein